MVLWGISSDRRGERIWHVALPLLLAAAAFLVASATSSNAVSLAALSLAVIAIYPVLDRHQSSLVVSRRPCWRGRNGLVLRDRQPGAFFGPSIMGILRENTGGYSAAMAALSSALVIAAFIALGVGRAMAQAGVKVNAAPLRQ